MKESSLIVIFVLIPFLTVSSFAYASTPGVNPVINQAMTLKANITRVLDRASGENIVIQKPISIPALGCFSGAVEGFAKGASKLFSGDFSPQAKEPIEEGLLAHFKDLKWNDVISYKTDIAASAEIKFVAEVNVAVLDSFTGPTFKTMSCDNMQTAWMSRRNSSMKRTPGFNEIVNSLRTSETSGRNGQITEDITKYASKARRDVQELEQRQNRETVFAVDNPLKRDANICGAIQQFLGNIASCQQTSPRSGN